MPDPDELLDIVDTNARPMRTATKQEAHEQGLLHKTVLVELRNAKGDWILAKQSNSRQDAGQYVSVVGGHVRAGERNVDAMRREVFEEIGIKNFKHKYLGRHIYKRFVLNRHENHYFIVYEIVSDAPMTLNHEADSTRTFTQWELRRLLKASPGLFGGVFHEVIVKHFYPHLLNKQRPAIIKDVGFDFYWDEKKLWALEIPSEEVPIGDLQWQFDIPFWDKPDGGYYDLTARMVMEHPQVYHKEYERIMRADMRYPIDIMFWRGRWLILDGLHRLTRAALEHKKMARVRKIPASAIPLIQK